MSFDSYETSVDTGQPFELYEFTYGVNKYRYCTLPDSVEYDFDTWEPMQISRQAINLADDSRRSQLLVSAPRDFKIAQFFKIAQPAEAIYIKIFKKHRPDAEAIVEWIGRVMTAEWKNTGVQLTCESVYAALDKNSKIRCYSFSCPFVLYGENCKANKENFKVNTTLSDVSGTVLTSSDFSSKPDGWFVGGFMVWQSSDLLYFHRFITGHTGNQITIQQQIPDLVTGEEITAYAGCDHKLTTCREKFGNDINFGGFPWIPGKNPFTSDSSVYW